MCACVRVVCVCVCVRRGRVVQPPLCDPWFSSYGLAIAWHWTDGLVPHPLWFLFTWLRCLVSSSIFKYRTEATWISSRRAQKRIASCNVCTLWAYSLIGVHSCSPCAPVCLVCLCVYCMCTCLSVSLYVYWGAACSCVLMAVCKYFY